jgi:hypothetical protein
MMIVGVHALSDGTNFLRDSMAAVQMAARVFTSYKDSDESINT